MSNAPLVSIGLPVFNGQDFVAQAIESLLAQTHRDLELLISDNASTDDTEAICRDFAARDPRVRYQRNESNVGILANWHRGIERARGEYFMFASHDDLWEPTYIEELLGVFASSPVALDLAYPAYDWIDEAGRVVRTCKPYLHVEPGSRYADLLSFSARNSSFYNLMLQHFWRNPYPIFGLFKLSTLRRTPPLRFVLDDARGADVFYVTEILARARVQPHPKVLFHYRQRDRSGAAEVYRDPARRAGRREYTRLELEGIHIREALRVFRQTRGGPLVPALALPLLVAISGVKRASELAASLRERRAR